METAPVSTEEMVEEIWRYENSDPGSDYVDEYLKHVEDPSAELSEQVARFCSLGSTHPSRLVSSSPPRTNSKQERLGWFIAAPCCCGQPGR